MPAVLLVVVAGLRFGLSGLWVALAGSRFSPTVFGLK
jgi:hypothetical protein